MPSKSFDRGALNYAGRRAAKSAAESLVQEFAGKLADARQKLFRARSPQEFTTAYLAALNVTKGAYAAAANFIRSFKLQDSTYSPLQLLKIAQRNITQSRTIYVDVISDIKAGRFANASDMQWGKAGAQASAQLVDAMRNIANALRMVDKSKEAQTPIYGGR